MTVALTHYYRPRGSAKRLMESRAGEVLLSGPAGTGKSRACLEKMLACAVKYPGMRGLILRQTLASLGNTALVTWREHVAVEHLASGAMSYYGGSQSEAPQYRLTNGSTILIGGLDKPTKIMSSEYDLIYVQEGIELVEVGWEFAVTRLRNGKMPYQQLMADTNPDSPLHWLHQRCIRGTTQMINCLHEDNPRLFDDDGNPTPEGAKYIARLDSLTGVRLLRLRKGLWVASEGVIYEDWNPEIHLVDRFPIPASWPRFWVIDWGYTNPFVCQWWAESPDGVLVMYREIYFSQRTVDEHCDTIAHLVMRDPRRAADARTGKLGAWEGEWTEPKPARVIADHDAEDRASFRQIMGIGTSAADKRVGYGLQAGQRRFRPDGRGRAQVMFFKDALVEEDERLRRLGLPVRTVEEIPKYTWATPDVDVEAGKAPKEDPIKKDDHGCDCYRYLVMWRDERSGGGVRWA